MDKRWIMGLLALAAGLLFYLCGGQGSTTYDLGLELNRAELSGAGQPAVELRDEAVQDERASQRSVEPSERPKESASIEEEVDETSVETTTLRGRAVRSGVSGEVFSEDDGTLKLYCSSELEDRVVEAAVSAGTWTAEVPSDAAVWVDSLVLNDQRLAVSTDNLVVDANIEQIIHGGMLYGARLYVRAAVSGAELIEIDVARSSADYSKRYLPPTDSSRFLEREAISPIALPALVGTEGNGVQLYWVRAEGYAWNSIEIDHSSGGDRELRLRPAGTLRVDLRGELAKRDFELRVFEQSDLSSRPLARAEVTAARVEFEDLPSTELRVELIEDRYRRMVECSRARIELLPGEPTHCELSVCEATPSQRQLKLSGTLALPSGADDLARLALIFEVVRKVERPATGYLELTLADLKPLGAGLYGFGCELDVEGAEQVSYRVRANVSPLAWSQAFEVRSPGLTNIELRVPALAKLELEVIDARTREPVEGGHFWYITESTTRTRSARELRARPGFFEITTVAGGVTLLPSFDGYAGTSIELEATGGAQHELIELERECGFDLTFKDGEARVPMDPGVRFGLTDLEGEQQTLGWSEGGRLFLPGPGTYLLSFSDFAGFEDLVNHELHLELREFRPLELQLTRSE